MWVSVLFYCGHWLLFQGVKIMASTLGIRLSRCASAALAVVAVCCGGATAQADEVVITADADVYLDRGHQTTNQR